MNKIVFIIALLFVFLSNSTRAVQNPVGSPTTPPSSRKSGLVKTINPIDTSSNLTVTGNVRRGRHFRGIVPYQSYTDFRVPTASSTIESFLRDSAGSEDFGSYKDKYQPQPYYSQTRSVTSTSPAGPAIFRPTYGRIATPPVPPSMMIQKPEQEFTLNRLVKSSYQKTRPMEKKPWELEDLSPLQIAKYRQTTEKTDEQDEQKLEKFRSDLKLVTEKTAEVKQQLLEQKLYRKPQEPKKVPDIELTSPDLKTRTQKQTPAIDNQMDVYEKMKLQVSALEKELEKPARKTDSQKLDQADSEKGDLEKKELSKELAKVSLLATKAKKIMGEHKTFASYSKDKFNQHMRAAEEYLQNGKFYRAADAYTLASIYKPQDPLPYAGKSHALFAAGEYMSSSLFLNRAISMFPEYANFKIDLLAMLKDRDKLESRIVDVEEWVKKSDAGELHFLLAYVYHQLGRPDKAIDSIRMAYKKMPDDPAVAVLKNVIENAR
jgi:tetratricopeptide (TPR) repeat protein